MTKISAKICHVCRFCGCQVLTFAHVYCFSWLKLLRSTHMYFLIKSNCQSVNGGRISTLLLGGSVHILSLLTSISKNNCEIVNRKKTNTNVSYISGLDRWRHNFLHGFAYIRRNIPCMVFPVL